MRKTPAWGGVAGTRRSASVPATGAEDLRLPVAGQADLPAGSGIEWVNLEAADYPAVIGNHNVVADSLTTVLPDTTPFPAGSALIPPGQSWACDREAGVLSCKNADGKTVPVAPGRYSYMCGIHPNQMHGMLVVT